VRLVGRRVSERVKANGQGLGFLIGSSTPTAAASTKDTARYRQRVIMFQERAGLKIEKIDRNRSVKQKVDKNLVLCSMRCPCCVWIKVRNASIAVQRERSESWNHERQW
jgi:hypothetical protein